MKKVRVRRSERASTLSGREAFRARVRDRKAEDCGARRGGGKATSVCSMSRYGSAFDEVHCCYSRCIPV